MHNHTYLKTIWPAPSNIHAFTTTRLEGHSQSPYDYFNLGLHVGDNAGHVQQNRKQLINDLNLPAEPLWLDQVHSTTVLDAKNYQANTKADAIYSVCPKQVCVILTADCLPLLICNKRGNQIAAIHAGWRGLAHGIIGKTIKHFAAAPNDLLVWLGPAIGGEHYEVGDEVYETFLKQNNEAKQAFIRNQNKRWQANLYTLAKQELQKLGVNAIYGGNFCTFSDKKRFFSYRRDKITGRMASLIWFTTKNELGT